MDQMINRKRINAVIVAGSFSDLSVVDFSVVNIRCFNLKNKAKLKRVSDQFKPLYEDYYSLFNIIQKDAKKIIDESKYVHVLLPVDFDKGVPEYDYFRCVEILKLLYPSDLAVQAVAYFDIDDQKNIEWSSSGYYNFHASGDSHSDHYLFFPNDKKHVEGTNNFIKLYFERIGEMPYLRIAMDAYINSFTEIPLHMSFISLCMALETVVDGTSEIVSRIRRTVAMVCADNSHVAQIIYANVNKIYKLRSKMVHGDTYDYKLVKEYHPYLRSLISRMIVQLIYTDYKTATELQEKILFCRFCGQEGSFYNRYRFAEYKVIRRNAKFALTGCIC